MKLIQLILTIIIGMILLTYLWPLFLFFILVIGFFLLRMVFAVRKAARDIDPVQTQRDLSQDDDIEQPVRGEVFDAEYKERE
ncbi:MAG: hypothetical protein JXK92_04430 [Erysipelotrichaceae bacterium]|nr:hypothetical protein [Erysipelotrichaceae bacterium]